MTWEPTPSLKCLRRSPVVILSSSWDYWEFAEKSASYMQITMAVCCDKSNCKEVFYQPVGKYTFFLGIEFPLTANNHLPTGWEIDIFTHNQWLQVSSRPVSRDVWLVVTLIHLTIHCHTSKMTDLNTTRSLFAHPQVSPPAGHKKAMQV